MSVFVKDMELPIQCASCPMWTIMAIGGVSMDICRAKSMRVDPYRTGRDENCPLVEVPVPHGDLIDGDELYREVAKAHAYEHLSVKRIIAMIRKSPAVIEAEE